MRYRIIRVPAQAGIDWLNSLAKAVDSASEEGWVPTGGPFYDGSTLTGCQAMYRALGPPLGEMRLREPKKR